MSYLTLPSYLILSGAGADEGDGKGGGGDNGAKGGDGKGDGKKAREKAEKVEPKPILTEPVRAHACVT